MMTSETKRIPALNKRSLPAALKTAVTAALDKKAEDVCVLDLRNAVAPAKRGLGRPYRVGPQACPRPPAGRRGKKPWRMDLAGLRNFCRPHLLPYGAGLLRPG